MNLTLEISKFNSPTAKQEVVYRVIENGKPIAAKHLDRAGNYIGAHVYKQPTGFSFELFNCETEPRGEVYGTAWVEGIEFTDGTRAPIKDGIIQDIEAAAVKATGLALLFIFGCAVAAAFIWG